MYYLLTVFIIVVLECLLRVSYLLLFCLSLLLCFNSGSCVLFVFYVV